MLCLLCSLCCSCSVIINNLFTIHCDILQWHRSGGGGEVGGAEDNRPHKKYRGESIFLFEYDNLPGKISPLTPPQKKNKKLGLTPLTYCKILLDVAIVYLLRHSSDAVKNARPDAFSILSGFDRHTDGAVCCSLFC